MAARRTADVVIVGGGVVGASIAFHLTEAGCRNVLVLDREREPAGGSTGRATGGARAQFATSPEIAMSIYSLDMLTRFEELTGVSPGYRPYGYLFLASTAEELATLRAAREKQQAAGLRDVELLEPKDVSRLIPALRTDDLTGAAFRAGDGLIEPRAILRGFLAAAERQGARIEFGMAVEAIEVSAGRTTGVQTHGGGVSAPVVVIAAGAWSATLTDLVGIALPVTPLRRQIAGTRSRASLPERLPMVIDIGSGFHFRRDFAAGDDAYLFAWPEPDAPFGFETRYEASFGERVIALAARRCPPLGAATIDRSRCRAGLYEMTPDHRAIIDRAPGIEGLFLATGFSGHGVMHAPATGRIVADLILRGSTDAFDISPLRATRFGEGVTGPEMALL